MASSVIKRNGAKVDFDEEKIASAVFKAYANVYPEKSDADRLVSAKSVAKEVVRRASGLRTESVDVEEIQNLVEAVLMEADSNVAKAYILYRNKRAEIRALRASIGIPDDDLKLPINTLIVLAARYLLKSDGIKITETPKQLFNRVAYVIASAEKAYGKSDKEVDELAKRFYDALVSFDFMPNSPTLMNAGTPLGQLSACFVLPVGDSIEEIFDALKYAALVHKSGGGTGFAFSKLRPANDIVHGTSGVSSGPLSFMKIFDTATDQIKQGGKRRGANMGILSIHHPDILNFIMAKETEGTLRNFNISVAMTDSFMKALQNDREYDLINPRTGKAVGKLNSRAVWNLIITMAWKTGDPGIVFIDRMNSTYSNPVPKYGPIESTNPCVTGDTLISTAYGMRRAETLAATGIPNTVLVDRRFGADCMQVSSPVVMTGMKQVVRLSTREGFEIKLTRDHKVYSAARGWVEAASLQKGELIRIANAAGAFGKEGSAAEGRILGQMVGSQHINPAGADEMAALPLYNSMAPDLRSNSDANPIIWSSGPGSRPNSAGVATIQVHRLKTIASERLGEHAVERGPAEDKLAVLDRVFSGSEELQRGFLQSLFEADGMMCVADGAECTIRLASTSEQLLSKVQLLLLNFGVLGKIRRNWKGVHTKALPGPSKASKQYGVEVLHELSIEGSNTLAFNGNVGFLSECKNGKAAEAIRGYAQSQYPEHFLAAVEAIDELGSEAVYDLTEPVTHSFIANGIVVHNCGEQPLYPYDSCNLGAINLSRMVKKTDDHYEVDWEKLRETARLGVRFLDNVIDANKYPIPQISNISKAVRRIGLGIMGWADMLIKLGVRYDSTEAIMLAERVMGFISREGRQMSTELAVEKGPFPEFNDSIWYKLGYKPLRNSTVTTIAPTGTTSIIAGGASQGIEPIFSVVYMRNVKESLGSNLIEMNPEFERQALENGFYSEELMKKLAGRVSIQDVEEIPPQIRKLFVTAYDIAPSWHVKMQAAFQKYTDNAVSKTINFPSYATLQDIEGAYLDAYRLGCKGITVYRDSSKSVQVLQAVDKQANLRLLEAKAAHEVKTEEASTVSAIRDAANTYVFSPGKEKECPVCGSRLFAAEGCFTCAKCGYSECS